MRNNMVQPDSPQMTK